MAMHDLEINYEMIPDKFKCIKCKFMLKDACQVPCGCLFCRLCISEMMNNGQEFCPGVSDECRESPLSQFLLDYRANRSIAKLNVKCPYNGCLHECQLADMEEHMRVCSRKNLECPFRQLGCKQDKLTSEELNGHFQQESRRHSDILIGMIANISNELEGNKREIEILKERDNGKMKEIQNLKRVQKNCNNQIDRVKRLVAIKNGQLKSVINSMRQVKNENELIKQEIENLVNRTRISTDRIDDRREISQPEVAVRSVRSEIQSVNGGNRPMNLPILPIQVRVGLGPVDARCELVIDADVREKVWIVRASDYFFGAVRPYKYRLEFCKRGSTGSDKLRICLRLYNDPDDVPVSWPFEGTVTIIVADRNNSNVFRHLSYPSRIEQPLENWDSSCSEMFRFTLAELTAAGLSLGRGVNVLCLISFGTG